MDYVLTFIEGFASFISPCMLPMIPIYLSYFAGDNDKKVNVFLKTIFFVLGFTFVFCILGVFAGTIGGFLNSYKNIVNIVCGIIVIIFGLNIMGVLKFNIFKGINKKIEKINRYFSAFIFGIIFSINLTPCTGAFLGSALMMASTSAIMFKGFTLLLVYSLGLGIPIIISAVLINKLNNVFNFIKKNYKVINIICGVFLIVVGILMMFGLIDKILYSLL